MRPGVLDFPPPRVFNTDENLKKRDAASRYGMRYVFTIRRLDRIAFGIKVSDPLIVFFNQTFCSQFSFEIPVAISGFFCMLNVNKNAILRIYNRFRIRLVDNRTSTPRTSR